MAALPCPVPPPAPEEDDREPGRLRRPSRRERDGRTWVKIGNAKIEMRWCAGEGCVYGNKIQLPWLEDCPRCGAPQLCRTCREHGHGSCGTPVNY